MISTNLEAVNKLTNPQTHTRKTLIVEVWDTSCTAPKNDNFRTLIITKNVSLVTRIYLITLHGGTIKSMNVVDKHK